MQKFQPNVLNTVGGNRTLSQHYLGGEKGFQIISCEAQEGLAKRLVTYNPQRFQYHPTKWGKFADGTDEIEIGGFTPENKIRGEHVLFLASFHNNDVTLSQFHVIQTLCESFVETLTVVLPYYPTGTMERVTKEGQVATASTLARLFSNLPRIGKPIRVAVYDLHTLQNRFYLSGNALASLHSGIPLLLKELGQATSKINCVAFPDEGACKRFSYIFTEAFPDWPIVICGKVRDGEKRIVTIQDGNPDGKHCIIVDDLVQTGGTLVECAGALRRAGAGSVSAFVTHAVFPKGWKKFSKVENESSPFETFFVTNSNPTVTDKLPQEGDVFKVLDIMPQLVKDL
uniref:Phosphoribosyltransferase domain-containing protein n=1 Tax=Hemiselmis andersenii TaxID=464988 RepID=A0A7S0U286_HEMAN